MCSLTTFYDFSQRYGVHHLRILRGFDTLVLRFPKASHADFWANWRDSWGKESNGRHVGEMSLLITRENFSFSKAILRRTRDFAMNRCSLKLKHFLGDDVRCSANDQHCSEQPVIEPENLDSIRSRVLAVKRGVI